MSKPFSAPYKKLKDLNLGVYEECLGRQPAFIPGKTPVYLDPRGDTSLVVPIPGYYVQMLGDSIEVNGSYIRVEQEPKTLTRFLRTKASVDAIEKLFRSVGNEYRERVMAASRRKVIAYALAYSATGAKGRRVSQGQPAFSDLEGNIIGFNFVVRYEVSGKLYTMEWRDYDDAEETEENGTLSLCLNDRSFHVDHTIDWSPEAEAACVAFRAAIGGIGQRLHDYFSQPTAALKLALESRVNPLLAAPEKQS